MDLLPFTRPSIGETKQAALFGLYRCLGYGPGDFPAMSDEGVDRVCEAIEGLLHA